MAIDKKTLPILCISLKKSSVDTGHKFPAFQKKFWNDCREGMIQMENEKVCQDSMLEDIDFLKMFIKICPNTKLCYLYYSVDQNREPKGQLLQ